MYRLGLVAVVFLACSTAFSMEDDDKPALRQALALEETLRDVIKQAEPAIACVLVSRSDDYRKIFHDSPPADSPGKLGPFDDSKRERIMIRPSRRFMGEDPHRRFEEENRKYDLAQADAVPEAFGSGVVIDGEELLVLTCYHVIRDATKVYVRLPGGKGSYADIHAADPRSDLAVLRLLDTSLRPLKTIKFGDGRSAAKGQFVVTLANPFAAGFKDGSPSASWGIISNLRLKAESWPWEIDDDPRTVKQLFFSLGTLIQTDARSNLGCSGGALLNLRGEMIGLTTARAAAAGSETAGGFAIPLEPGMKRIIDKLRAGLEVEYGFLGVNYVPPYSTRDEGAGVAIDPLQDSPAYDAHLHKGDVIESINGVPIHKFDDLVLTVSMLLAGSEARLGVAGRSQPISVTLTKSYVRGRIIVSRKPAPVRGMRVDYTSVLFQQQELHGRAFFRMPKIEHGVFVSELIADSPTAALLKVNDVITHVKVGETEVPVNTPAEFYRETAKIAPSEPLELTLLNSNFQRPTVTIPGNALRNMQ